MGRSKATETDKPQRKHLSAKNRAAIKLLDEWMSIPDDMGKEWWDEFEKELEANRLNFDRERDTMKGDL